MAFLEQQLDPRITVGAQGGPTVPGRTKTYLPNGLLQQNFTATLPIHHYDIAYNPLSKADFQTVLDIWYVVMFTPYAGFRMKDWRDFSGTITNTSLTHLSGSTWQLNRTHVFGGVTFLRPIQKPLAGVVVYDAGGSPLTATVNTTTGIATVTGTPVTWAGEFDVPVTFSDDAWMTSLRGTTNEMYVDSGPIKLEEIRL